MQWGVFRQFDERTDRLLRVDYAPCDPLGYTNHVTGRTQDHCWCRPVAEEVAADSASCFRHHDVPEPEEGP